MKVVENVVPCFLTFLPECQPKTLRYLLYQDMTTAQILLILTQPVK